MNSSYLCMSEIDVGLSDSVRGDEVQYIYVRPSDDHVGTDLSHFWHYDDFYKCYKGKGPQVWALDQRRDPLLYVNI